MKIQFLFFIFFKLLLFNQLDVNIPILFQDEICSFHGKLVDKQNNSYECECYEEYETINSSKMIKMINGIPIQCSHEKKSRIIALFFSIFTPFGLDYLYLGKYLNCLFFLILFLFIYCGVIYYTIQIEIEKNQDKEDKYYLRRDINNNNKYRVIFFILVGIYFLIYLLNILLMASGLIKDGYGIETLNDFNYLFSFL